MITIISYLKLETFQDVHIFIFTSDFSHKSNMDAGGLIGVAGRIQTGYMHLYTYIYLFVFFLYVGFN